MNDDGGPAFPVPHDARLDSEGGVVGYVSEYSETHQGMSLRDYLAGQALAGLLASHAGIGINTKTERSVGAMAYSIADYALAARKAVPNG